MASYGVRSPPPLPTDAPSPRPQFDSDTLKTYIKKLLSTTLQNESYPAPRDRDKIKAWCKEIGERVKEQMLEIQPRGFKYIVLTRIDENSGQGLHANLNCHWEEYDTVAQEMFSNDSLICVCVAFAIRTI
ncbi:uncharacterized protein FOMMEDRAFT_110552 [Fomitiporia mediterranea MF3/22]|uniref:uncharacterized protein n=1 Tax=Fomitiporia mediterranea (strain MF3/22) TaxID=694068 RepID=UPI0004407BE5|nr:uncharacterized protein FOMMEDRAFT_110552 [Fomitiporia mediterranea MF3/22]EJD01046.1 hypothetical protein FOMMEDRAFT_110552 [Fomitiporia mediterranea MF3/22]